MIPFEISGLDHVAIRVADMEASAAWYQKVLGLERYDVAEWGPFPVFMLKETFGVALFPASETGNSTHIPNKGIRIDHFAFNVSYENFEKARAHYQELNIDFNFQDHTYFHSIYTRDPDGHVVELTTLLPGKESFYKNSPL